MSTLSGLFGGGGNKAVSGTQKSYGKLFNGALKDYGDFHKFLEGAGLTTALQNSFNSMNEDASSKVQKFQNGANERAQQQANTQSQWLRSQGFNDGAIGGAGVGAFNQAQQATNAYAADVQSPEYQLQQLMALLQGVAGAQGLYASPLSQFSQGVYGAPQQQQGNPLLALLGQFAAGGAF